MKLCVTKSIVIVAIMFLAPSAIFGQSSCVCRPSPPGGVTNCGRGQIAVCGGNSKGECVGVCIALNTKDLDSIGIASVLLSNILGEKISRTRLLSETELFSPLLATILQSDEENSTVEIKFEDRDLQISVGLPKMIRSQTESAMLAMATNTQTLNTVAKTFTVIEYPLKKEVKVMLTPVTLTNAKGVATILRDDDGTRIVLNLSNVPAEVTALNLYAVDETGTVTSLGSVTITNGTGTLTATTPLNRFMLIGAPEGSLTSYDPNTKIFFRSAVPEGFAVITHSPTAVGEKVGAYSYTVAMLDIPNYKKGDDTKIKVNFSGVLTGARANVFITPRKDGPTEVKLRFHELKEAPAGKVFAVWAVSTYNKFVKLGQLMNTPGRNEAEVKAEVALPDFGLLITMEEADASMEHPRGPTIATVEIVP